MGNPNEDENQNAGEPDNARSCAPSVGGSQALVVGLMILGSSRSLFSSVDG